MSLKVGSAASNALFGPEQTNDNLPALYFYQRRGYRLTGIIAGSVLAHSTSVVNGFAGIPVRDEVHLEKLIG